MMVLRQVSESRAASRVGHGAVQVGSTRSFKTRAAACPGSVHNLHGRDGPGSPHGKPANARRASGHGAADDDRLASIPGSSLGVPGPEESAPCNSATQAQAGSARGARMFELPSQGLAGTRATTATAMVTSGSGSGTPRRATQAKVSVSTKCVQHDDVQAYDFLHCYEPTLARVVTPEVRVTECW